MLSSFEQAEQDKKDKIKLILDSIGNLSTAPSIIALLGDKAAALVANEFNNVKTILTGVRKSDFDKAAQVSQIMCTPESWLSCVTSIIQIGVTLDPTRKHAAIVPYSGKATIEIMVAGYKHLLFANNIVKKIDTNAILAQDKFHMLQPLLPETVAKNFFFDKGLDRVISDNPKVPTAYLGGYCFMVLQNGEYYGDYMGFAEIDKRRKSAKTQAIWNEWTLEMIEKTILKYCLKNLPSFTAMPFYGELARVEEQHYLDSPLSIIPEKTATIQPKAIAEKRLLTEDLDDFQFMVAGLRRADVKVSISDTNNYLDRGFKWLEEKRGFILENPEKVRERMKDLAEREPLTPECEHWQDARNQGRVKFNILESAENQKHFQDYLLGSGWELSYKHLQKMLIEAREDSQNE
jgi:recombinational DNA repair protein RecT